MKKSSFSRSAFFNPRVLTGFVFLALALACFAFSPHARAAETQLLTCSLNDNIVDSFDGTTGAFLKILVSSGSGGLTFPQNLTIGPDGNLYVTSWGTNSVKRYDRNTGAFIDDFVTSGSGGLANPDQLIFRPDGKLYVSSRFRGTISRYDAQTGAFVDTFVSDSRLALFTAFTFGPDGNIYAGEFNPEFNGHHHVLRFDGTTGQFIDVFSHGGTPIDVAITGLTFGSDGNLYACRWSENLVERYDGTTGAFIDDFVTAGSGGLLTADYLIFGPDGNLYVAGQGSGSILRYDGTTGAFIDVFTSGGPALIPKGLIFTAGNSSACLPPPAGLVSWWSGDRTAADVQGINNGTLVNGTSFRKGMVGPGFLFDGIDDYISVSNNASLNPGIGDFTFEFWISTTNSGAREAVLEKRPVCGAANFYQIKMNADGTIFSETMQDVNGTNFVTVTSTFPINDGVFHHVALTRQGVNVTLFIDGVENATGSSPTTCDLSNAAPFIVGLTVCTFDRTFSGKIDELTYYASALSPSAVQAIYTAGAAGKCKPEIFVASIDPSYTVSGHGFQISTSIAIQDVNGVGTDGATVQLGVILPSGSALTFPLKTDATGQADISFTVADSGLYRFKVRNVNHPTRTYDASLNIETTDTLVIP
jgi:Concanavalin A-like lectin/glucanases superfamily